MVGPRGLRKAAVVALFLLPSAVPLLLFTIVPMFGAAWISLHDWNLQSPMRWTGLDNYTRLLGDAATRDALLHTLYFLGLYLPLVYVVGLTLAVGLNRRFPGRNLLRSMYFLPVVTSWVVVALTWKWLLNPANGLVNQALEAVGIPGPGWWASAGWAIPSAVVASVWKDAGFVMVILLAGLQSIPEEYLEAARLDGASAWQTFWRVTFPLLTPSSYFVVVISLISGFQVFDQIYVMTGGGPAGASRPLVEQIYDLTFRYGDAGGASALSLMLFALILVVTVVQQRLQRRWVTYV
ncbi:sugar ABC transporter permease [Dactylosporangium sp. AC04546]|uniref:carbohydrate ABC transporter permease n=1 Tax=Dactylosporangium sp. AC04546 TaxID=2862460 RepID=UPI001EDDF21D|nr:sugar ABC transporter permease [Dactylosporangium sp. AC04546]WVK80949.1 sugar ABC transporter permease [Dactylosporangium sp. AC04546]